MSTPRFAVTLILLSLSTATSCLAEDGWKVTNRGRSGTYIVRLRPASNRKVGFAISAKLKPGETRTLPLTYQGTFDINILFVDKDENVMNSWTADQPVDLRKRIVPEPGDNLVEIGKQDPPTIGPDGKMVMGQLKWMPLLNGMNLKEPMQRLVELGAVNTQDSKNPRVDFEGGVMVRDKVIHFHISGPPDELSIAIDGQVYKIADLAIFRSPQEGHVVVSGIYSRGDGTSEFLLERRNGFPFYRFNLDLKTKGALDWSSFRLGPLTASSQVKRGEGAQIDDIRDAVFEAQQPLKEAQAHFEQRLVAMEAKLDGRMAELELRLVDPNIYRIVKSCVDCHRTDRLARAPRNIAALLSSIPNMSKERANDMFERSKLDEQDKVRFQDYAKELARSFAP